MARSEADHPHQSSSEVKREWSYTSAPHTPSWRAQGHKNLCQNCFQNAQCWRSHSYMFSYLPHHTLQFLLFPKKGTMWKRKWRRKRKIKEKRGNGRRREENYREHQRYRGGRRVLKGKRVSRRKKQLKLKKLKIRSNGGEGTEIILFEVWDFTGGAFCEWLQVPPKLC